MQLEEEFPSRTFRLTTEMMGDDGNVNRLLAWLGFPGCRLKGHRVNANQNGTHVGNGTFAHVNCD